MDVFWAEYGNLCLELCENRYKGIPPVYLRRNIKKYSVNIDVVTAQKELTSAHIVPCLLASPN